MDAKKKVFLEIFRKNLCNISESCKKAGIQSRQTFYNWLDDEEFRIAVEETEEELLDFVEAQQMYLIRGVPKYRDTVDQQGNKIREFVGWEEKPDKTLIKWFLETKGRKRGYIVKRQLELQTPDSERASDLSDEELDTEIKQLLLEESNERGRSTKRKSKKRKTKK